MSTQLAPPRSRMARFQDLGIRTASATVLIPVTLFGLIVGGWVWAALIAVFFVGLLREGRALSRHARPCRRTVFLLCGLAYTGLPGAALLWLRARPGAGLDDVLFLLLVVWMTDIGAYLVGRLLGGRKLAPTISPGKTVSGALGGLIIGSLAGMIFAGSPLGILPAAVLSLVSEAGDLAESAVKRWLGVKDSGHTIPGHGGLFDRLDGILAAAPVAALLALIAHGGVPLWR
ncbi:MAG: phosphatidate cytidylyltransferase [Acidiphilium sp.]|nr:phosphatidate cytidylyltransferase [Acidiphilium sp.]MDD4935873.1 phosphatidate cytidylyltransferase [Acidiphilium sp.]